MQLDCWRKKLILARFLAEDFTLGELILLDFLEGDFTLVELFEGKNLVILLYSDRINSWVKNLLPNPCQIIQPD